MRLLLSSFLILSFSCGGGSSDVFGDAQWQVHCGGRSMCSRNGLPVDVFEFDGNEGTRADCSIIETDSGDRLVSFTLADGDQLLSVAGFVTSAEGGTVRGENCAVTVIDDSNTYGQNIEHGRCGANPPSESQPCQLGPVTFNRDGMDGPEMTTTLLCDGIAAPANPDLLQRDIIKPMAPGMPAEIRLIHCEGI